MAERPAHVRSKSARVLNLPRGDLVSRREGSELSSPQDSSPFEPFPPLSVRTQSTASDHFTPIDTASSQSVSNNLEPSSTNRTLEMAEKGSPTSIQNSNMSIEDTVKTFRVFEALRGGNIAAIGEVLQEDKSSAGQSSLAGTTVLHLAIQCAEPHVVDYVIKNEKGASSINAQDREGNTPLHLAAHLGRSPIVKHLLEQPDINDAIVNYHNHAPIDIARTPEIFQQLQLARSLYTDKIIREIQSLVSQNDYKTLEELLKDPKVESTIDVNALELPTDQITVQSGGTLLHEAARKKDIQLAQLLLMHGADPFRRDRRGKLPQDVTKDDRTRSILKKSPAAAVAQRGIQEKAILGVNTHQARSPITGTPETKDAREMKGYLKKWTNYTSGYKLRWFVLEDGVLSYYKHQGLYYLCRRD
jgi:oxysterol-binding protein 1